MEEDKNGSDKNVGSIEEDMERCEQLTKLEHANWIGLSNQHAIEHLIKAYKELEEENKRLKPKIDVCNWQEKSCREIIDEKYIPVSLVEEKRTKLKEQYNKVVNEINNQGMIEQLIDFKEVSAKLEMCEELLEKRK